MQSYNPNQLFHTLALIYEKTLVERQSASDSTIAALACAVVGASAVRRRTEVNDLNVGNHNDFL